ncbi:MAG: hypothetical protein MJ105_06620 [Lachnospiraceae bacterium]|nr:hypothetical protein [Lachnospiraceae bacterium]
MRKEKAFNFIPELVGDFSKVMKLTENPTMLYVESAVSTIKTAAAIFKTIKECENTRHMKETMQGIQGKYEETKDAHFANLEEEEIRKLDIEYEKVKMKLRDREFRDEVVMKFIGLLKKNLEKIINIKGNMPIDSEYVERDKIDEMFRRALRDYNRLVNKTIVGGKN